MNFVETLACKASECLTLRKTIRTFYTVKQKHRKYERKGFNKPFFPQSLYTKT